MARSFGKYFETFKIFIQQTDVFYPSLVQKSTDFQSFSMTFFIQTENSLRQKK